MRLRYPMLDGSFVRFGVTWESQVGGEGEEK